MVSRIEKGPEHRRVREDELMALPDALGVPFWQLVAPEEGERPLRAGVVGLEHHEVPRWLAHGDLDGVEGMSADEVARLTRALLRARELADRDPSARNEHLAVVARLVGELHRVTVVYARAGERQWRRRTHRRLTDSY